MDLSRRMAELECENARLKAEIADLRANTAAGAAVVEELRAVLAVCPVAIWIARDPECRQIDGNRAAHEFSRVPAGVDLSKTGPPSARLRDYRIFRGGVELAPDEMPLQAVARTGQALVDDEIEFVFDGGTVKAAVGNVMPLLDAAGVPCGAVGAYLDVTARRQHEEGEERLGALMDHNPSLVFMKDEDGRYVYLNGAYERQFTQGQAWQGKTDFDLWPEESARLFREDDAEVLRTGEMRQFLEDSTDLDGTRHCWLCYKFPFVDGKGRRYVGGIGIDATGQVEAQEALEESAERYRQVVENTTAIVLRVDPHGTILFANRRALEFFGYRAEELIGKHAVGTVVPPLESTGRDLASMVDRIAADPDRFHHNENENIRRNGERVWVEWTNSGVYDASGELKESLAVGIDATERKWSEERARSLQEVTAALTGALTPMEVSDVILNEGLRAMGARGAGIGILVDGGEEIDLRSTVGVPEGAVPEWHRVALHNRTVLTEAVRRGRTILVPSPGEFVAFTDPSDETGVPWLGGCAAAPMRVGNRLLGGVYFNFGDTRVFRVSEMALLEAIAGLTAQALERARLYAAAERSTAELREADRRKDEFLAMLAHELRNPLSAITSAAHMLGAAELQGRFGKASEVVSRQGRHMARLLDDLLDVSRVFHGKITLDRERMLLMPAVESAVEAVLPRIEEAGHRLSVVTGGQRIEVEGDPVRVAQAVGNLLSNAVKYTAAPGEIWLTVESHPGEVAIRVRDNGMGITPELLPHVFDLFVQADNSVSREKGGLGIGLTMVRSLIEMHGGRVEAHSGGLGQGSEFTIWLPLAAPLAEEEPEQDVAVVRSRRILVVDDNADGAEILALVLEEDGHETATATSGPQALQVVGDFHPEVILLDLGMPLMDGYEVARRIRANPELAGVVLVAFTGYGQNEDRQRTAEAGFDYHLVKPALPKQVLQVLRDIGSDNRGGDAPFARGRRLGG